MRFFRTSVIRSARYLGDSDLPRTRKCRRTNEHAQGELSVPRCHVQVNYINGLQG
jgi:hypothetical protein